ncbi:ARM repeat-containing protein [Lactarius deliciosus]|nr:ARM repeat-containing protein [Lactarius deliciosus]
MTETQDREVFRELKRVCVPLLENSLLTPVVIPRVLSLLQELQERLQKFHDNGSTFSPSLVSYIVFPLTSLLRRNEPTAIPDRILELILLSLRILCEDWWWYCDLQSWEQLFMLCSTFVGNIEGKGKGKERDDESKEAAICCLIALTRKRGMESLPTSLQAGSSHADTIFSKFLVHTRSAKFVPILGQTLNALITTADSSSLRLQRTSLELLHILFEFYVSEDFAPTVLPGVVSTMSRIALGSPTSKGWANGEIVSLALSVMQEAIIKSVGDDVCKKETLVRDVTDLDDLIAIAEGIDEREMTPAKGYHVTRTPSWLRATSSQLLMALKSLTPIVSHPTATALIAVSSLSASLLESTSLTLPSTQPLLASFLLSLSRSDYDSVSSQSFGSLIELTSPASKVRHALLQTLLQMIGDILSSLPRILPSRADAKVEHLAGQVEAICRLVISNSRNDSENFSALSKGVGKLFGPIGGIEKWGWRLLVVMEFDVPLMTVTGTPAARLMLEQGPDYYESTFPELLLKHVASRSAQATLERMFRALGNAGGEACLYAVEWFTAVGRNRRDGRGVAALWLGCRLLEGIAGISTSVSEIDTIQRRSKRLDRATRGLSRSIAELWEVDDLDSAPPSAVEEDHVHDIPSVEHVHGLIVLDKSLRVGRGASTPPAPKTSQPVLHNMAALQVLSVTAQVLQAQFIPVLLHALYPILHSIISPVAQLSDSGLAALNIVASSVSYASPANLLLSNFDYVLDAVLRRLSRQRLDVDAIKVLLLVIRLVGRDVIQKAADVVEECFDRLDEYHGYDIIVDGLVEVLLEVIKVVESDEDSHVIREEDAGLVIAIPPDHTRMDAFEKWFRSRNDAENHEENSTEYGPAPRRPWGKSDATADEESDPADSQKQVDQDAVQVTPIQALSKQIVSRTIYFLTHESATIRAKILALLSSAVPVLPESALLASVHQAWPFILNRLSDAESFVVTAAVGLVEALSVHVGSFMYRRVWDDVWPRFKVILQRLEVADSQSALARRGPGSVGTLSSYTQSHRLYLSMLKTMTASVKNVQVNDTSLWEILLYFRRFLHCQAHKELQTNAVELFVAAGKKNADATWLVLFNTTATGVSPVSFLQRAEWDIKGNSNEILRQMQESGL